MGLARSSVWAGLALLLAAATGSAQSATDTPPSAAACLADSKRFCSTVQAGGGRILECLARQLDQLDAACKGKVEPVAEAILDWRSACGADIDARCATDELGVALGRCLQRHEKDLAPACRVKLGAATEYLALACGAQASVLCPRTVVGEGRYLACLADQRAQLTAPCADVFQWFDARYQQGCTQPIAEHCGGDAAYGHSFPCLQPQQRRLPPECQQLVASPVRRPAGGQALGDGPFAGRYASNWGLVRCRQPGKSRVECRYEYGGGKLSCVANRQTLVCSWREGPEHGRATLVQSAEGHLSGTWGRGQRATGGGAWVFAKID